MLVRGWGSRQVSNYFIKNVAANILNPAEIITLCFLLDQKNGMQSFFSSSFFNSARFVIQCLRTGSTSPFKKKLLLAKLSL